MDLSSAVSSISTIMGKISELNSSYNEAFRIMGGLSGALLVMTEFIEKRINDGNPVNDVAFQHMIDTLKAIEDKIDEIAEKSDKKLCCIPYGKWYIWGSPIVAGCFGRIGSTKIIKQLTDLEGDLNGDIKFLELHMTANAVHSLHKLAEDKVAAVFMRDDGKQFWASHFDEQSWVNQKELATKFNNILSEHIDLQNDSDLSMVNQVSGLVSSSLSHAGKVSAKRLASEVGTKPFKNWLLETVGTVGRSVILPGHTSDLTCISSNESCVITGSKDMTVKVFTIMNGCLLHRCTLVGHNDTVTAVAISSKTSTIVSGSADGFIRTWSMFDGTSTGCYSVQAGVKSIVCWDDKMAYSCGAPALSINVCLVKDGSYVNKLTGHVGGTNCLDHLVTGEIVSGGINRALAMWDECEKITEIEQCHPSKIIKVVGCSDFVASLSKNSIKFHTLDGLTELVSAADFDVSKGRIMDACSAGSFLAVLASKSTDENAICDAWLLNPITGEVKCAKTPAGSNPKVVTFEEHLLYMGLKNGEMLVYDCSEEKGTLISSVASASVGTDPVIPSWPSKPGKVVSNGSSVAYHSPMSKDLFITEVINGKKTKHVDMKCEISSMCCHKNGWLVGKDNGNIDLVTPEGSSSHKIKVQGSVLWMSCSSVRPKHVFLDVSKGTDSHEMFLVNNLTNTESVWYVQPISSRSCDPCLVLGDRFMVRGGYKSGTLSVMDSVRMTPMGSLDFTAMEDDPITKICSASDSFFTLHAGMDLLKWVNVTDGPVQKVRTYSNPVSSICSYDNEDKFLIGMIDGSVKIDENEKDDRKQMNHSVGPVDVCMTDGGAYSLGTERRLMPVGL
ncbi:WD40 repeat-containing protein [Tetraselmis virus 1]|uniref:WD40 repeat-containing protein n=1 Tax=Tetraselmis virus 1 TaxID=2060617 RepID=A0A2P0VN19_9VIRU|nr:WD40 repeat-containing protein [Tetraselmis virus 1]AUF82304.1 WD40 repeat-containing protein [Tetraselmis virus 1]